MFDVFLWANRVDEVKNQVKAELFLFNKNYTPYKVKFNEGLDGQIKALFLLDAIGFVNSGAETGLQARDLGDGDDEDSVIYRIALDKVGRAETLIHLIEKQYADITYFKEDEHSFRLIKGIVVRFTYQDSGAGGEQKFFYMAKHLAPGQALKGASGGWEVKDETFEPFSADVGIKIPADNQVLIADGTIVAFDQGKFEKLFQYDHQSAALAESKAKEITEKYQLSFPEGLTLEKLLLDKKPLIKKLQDVAVGEIAQEKLLEYADEMNLELMTDEKGAIIIMDDRDLGMFVNLLSEDYMVSSVTGKRYEIKSKKLIQDDGATGEPPRG